MSPILSRARCLAALRELAVDIAFVWRDFSCFRARPYDHQRDGI